MKTAGELQNSEDIHGQKPEDLLRLYGQNFDALLENISAGERSEEDTFASARVSPKIIGWVRSELLRPEDCPEWPDRAPEADLEILPLYVDGLNGLKAGQSICLLTWLYLADRDVLQTRGTDPGVEQTCGVFSSDNQDRPNPIGLHSARILRIEDKTEHTVLRVDSLGVLEGTPILDIKANRRDLDKDESSAAGESEILAALCREAYAAGLMPGFSGNASLRSREQYCLITRSGVRKGGLAPDDFAVVDFAEGRLVLGSAPSSETPAHLEVYRRQPRAAFILHTHPASLLALGLRYPDSSMEERLDFPIFESAEFRRKLGSTPRLPPGTGKIALAVGEVAQHKQLVWMEGHGLLVWGESAGEVLALSEMLEHMATVRLRSL